MGLRFMNKETLLPSEVQRLGLKFIQSKHYNAKVTIDRTELITDGAVSVYHLGGSIKIPMRGMVAQLLYRQAPGYTFSMQVHAVEGSILSYELR